MYFTGIIIAVITFLIIGVFHPIVIKTEYHFGTKPWWLFLLLGCAAIGAALAIENVMISALHGVFEQKKRCERGWFPQNPKRKGYYRNPDEVRLWIDPKEAGTKEKEEKDENATDTRR